ncbi:hypothetical protein JGS39_11630 [Streptomyces sp. P01-B04]|uniref:hypothetical protein n=1 Tax=Streptomyces poriferorum TaxID=2798799 RepID=UPI001C5D1337|nr:hypothetical protein [Streptomyces poriferorum]MBW5249644.1 hypothetical protein [Streptomyces poriferorum]MBW5259747.1 hypothetical protein [Streptomyces poriferorum]
MTLARSLPDSATEWWIYLGAFSIYALTRLVLAWRQARDEGAEHPVRSAFTDEEPEEPRVSAAFGAFRSYRQLFGFFGGAVAIVLIATLTDGQLRLVLMCTLAPLIIMGLAWLDFRVARAARSRSTSSPEGDRR